MGRCYQRLCRRFILARHPSSPQRAVIVDMRCTICLETASAIYHFDRGHDASDRFLFGCGSCSVNLTSAHPAPKSPERDVRYFSSSAKAATVVAAVCRSKGRGWPGSFFFLFPSAATMAAACGHRLAVCVSHAFHTTRHSKGIIAELLCLAAD